MFILLGKYVRFSEQTTHNGPLVTKIVNDILKNDTDFQPYRIETLDEIAGIHFIILKIVQQSKLNVVNNWEHYLEKIFIH